MYDSPACEAVNADCLKCPKAVDNLILYASHSRGFHFIMPKCDNNIIMFLLKGEALVNSEEYAGVTLHAGEFILQAVGSKYEVLAMTDVECVCYRFSQPESFCEGRFQHIVKDVVPPLIFFPLKICSELNFFLEASKSYLAEGKICRELLQFKQKELAFILWRYYSDYELSMLVHMSESSLRRQIKELFGYNFKDLLLQQRFERAKRLLEQTDLPIADIAQTVGYENTSFFYCLLYTSDAADE